MILLWEDRKWKNILLPQFISRIRSESIVDKSGKNPKELVLKIFFDLHQTNIWSAFCLCHNFHLFQCPLGQNFCRDLSKISTQPNPIDVWMNGKYEISKLKIRWKCFLLKMKSTFCRFFRRWLILYDFETIELHAKMI